MDLKDEKSPIVDNKYIDLEKVISSKNPKLLKRIPKFIINYLKRIVHLDEVNEFLYRHRNDYGFDFVNASIIDFNVDIEVIGLENIPTEGKQFIVSNHPLGGFDGLALIWAIHKVRDDVKFPVNDLLMNLPQMRPIFIPINKHGKNTENMEMLEENFAKEQLILYFPAGLVSRKQKGKIMDLEWKQTFINKARIHHRDIIPTYIEALNSSFFYNLARLREKLGIKANIEMLFLVNEVYKFKGKKIKIYFGERIPYQTFDKSKKPMEWAKWTREKVYNIQKQLAQKTFESLVK